MADWLARNKVHGGVDLSETLVTGVEWDGHSWDDYVNRVRQGRVWGNELTIHAFVHFSKTPVRVWTSRKGDEVVWNEINPVGYDSTHPVTAIDLGHVVENHYVSVIQRRDVPGQDKEDDTVVRGSPGDSNGPLWVHFADGIPASTNGGKKRTRTSPVTSPHNTSPLSGPAKRGRGLGTRSQTGAVRGAESDAVMAEAVTEEVRSCGICGTSAEPCKLQDNVWVCVDCAKDFNYWSVLSEPNDTDWKPPGKGSVSEVSTKQDLSRASSPIQGLGGGAAGGGVKDIGAVQGVSVQKNRAAVTTSATVDTSESSLQGAVQPQGPTGLAPPDVSRQQEVMRGNRRSPSPVAKGRRGSGNNSVTGNGRGRSSTSLDPVIMEEEGFTAESPPMPHDHVQYRSTDQVTGVVSWLDAVVESVDHSLSPPTVMLLILEEGSLGRPRETELDHLRKSSPSDLGGHSSADILPDFSGVYYQGGSGTGFGGGFKTTRACKTLLDYLGGGGFDAKAKALIDHPPAVWTATTRKAKQHWTGSLCIVADLLGQTEVGSAEHGCLFSLVLIMPMLLRRRTGRVGELTSSVNRRNEQRMMKNCDLLRAGRLSQLLDEALRAGEAAENHARERAIKARKRVSDVKGPTSEVEWARKVTRAEELARRGNLSKGFATLTQPGLAAHDAVDELKAKHPFASPPDADHNGGDRWTEEPEPLKPSEVKRAIRKSAPAGAADRFGWCIREDLECLYAKLSAPEPSIFTNYVLAPFLGGSFPTGAFDSNILWGGTLLALSKAPKPGSRPVVIGLALRRVTLKAVMPRYRKDLEGYFLGEHPRVKQFAAGVQDGATRAYKLIQQLLDDLETDDERDPIVAMALDATNAFNCLSRQTLFDTLAGIAQEHYDAGLLGEVKPGEELPFTTDILRTLNPMLKECYTDPALVRHFSSALGEAINLAVSRGVQQGDVLGSVLWCLALHPVLCRVMDRHVNVHCVAFADNVWCIGKLSDVLPATSDLATAMEKSLTVTINVGESYIYAPAFQRDNTLHVTNVITAMGEDLGPLVQSLLKGMSENRTGVSVLGVPLGSEDYIRTFLVVKANRFIGDFPALNKLTDFKVYLNFVRFCLAPRLHYLLRAIDPALTELPCNLLDFNIRYNLLEVMGWEAFDPSALDGSEPDTTQLLWIDYYIFGSLARGSLGIPRAADVATPAFYCATVDYVTAMAALELPLRDLECPSLESNSQLLRQLAEAHQQLLNIGCGERDQHLGNSAGAPGMPGDPRVRPPPALTRLCDLHPLGVKLSTNPPGVSLQARGQGSRPAKQVEDDREQSCARKSMRSQIRPEQRTIREFCFDKAPWTQKALSSMPPGLRARMELRKPVLHERPTSGSPLHQSLVKVGINIEGFSLRTHTIAALYAITGWEDPLSFSEWRLVGTYLFGFISPTYPLDKEERQCPCGKELDEGGHHVQCCARHARGGWTIGHNAVQAVWKQAGEEAGFTARVDVAHGLPREFHNAGKICDILYIPTDLHIQGLTPILADVSLTHPFIGNAGDREQWGTYQGKNLCRRAQYKHLKHAWAETEHVVVPFVSDTLGSMSGESAAMLCLFAWCQAGREAEFFVEDWGDGAGADNGANALVEASKRAFRRWDARLTLAVWRATATRAAGPGARVVKNRGSRRNGAVPFPETGVFAPSSPYFKNV
jgi:hypothetical protein